MWDLSSLTRGSPTSSASEGGFLTPGPPGSPWHRVTFEDRKKWCSLNLVHLGCSHMELSHHVVGHRGTCGEAVFSLFWPAAIVEILVSSQPQLPDMSGSQSQMIPAPSLQLLQHEQDWLQRDWRQNFPILFKSSTGGVARRWYKLSVLRRWSWASHFVCVMLGQVMLQKQTRLLTTSRHRCSLFSHITVQRTARGPLPHNDSGIPLASIFWSLLRILDHILFIWLEGLEDGTRDNKALSFLPSVLLPKQLPFLTTEESGRVCLLEHSGRAASQLRPHMASMSPLGMKMVTIPTSQAQHVWSSLVSKGVDRFIHILGIMVFPIRERYLSWWTLTNIILGSPWTQGCDKLLSLPGAILYLTISNPNTDNHFSPGGRRMCYKGQPTHSPLPCYSKSKEGVSGTQLVPHQAILKAGMKERCTCSFCLQLHTTLGATGALFP